MSLISCAILFLLLIMSVKGRGRLDIRFIKFVNPGGLGDNGHCCDGRSIFCEPYGGCDHFFYICVDSSNIRSNSMDVCSVGLTGTDSIQNYATINFGSRIGKTANPIVLYFDRIDRLVKLKIKVFDDDSGVNNHDYVDTLVKLIHIDVNNLHGEAFLVELSRRTRLSLSMKFSCSPSWYGSGCQTQCSPNNRYSCGSDGRKLCNKGYTGEDCEININDCDHSFCKNGATCLDLLNDYKCQCSPGFSGFDCSEDINECENPWSCSGQAKCLNTIGSYTCVCPPGLTGKTCQTLIDHCASGPCSAQTARCVNEPTTYQCVCQPGWHGQHCTGAANPCAESPCLNNATCISSTHNHTCVCAPGWSGVRCERAITACDSSPCAAGASCIPGAGATSTFSCRCAAGWSGDRCQVDSAGRCWGRGRCVHGVCSQDQGVGCLCEGGYGGVNCDADVDECKESPCRKRGNCANTVGSFRCDCYSGYSGHLCEFNNDLCADVVCLHNGTCIKNQTGPVCRCLPRFTGKQCEMPLLMCSSAPCGTNGTCTETNNEPGYVCTCTDGTTANFCPSFDPDSDESISKPGNTDDKGLEKFVFKGLLNESTALEFVERLKNYTALALGTSYFSVEITYNLLWCEDKPSFSVFYFNLFVNGKATSFVRHNKLQSLQKLNIKLPLPLSNSDACLAIELISVSQSSGSSQHFAGATSTPWLLVFVICGVGFLLVAFALVIVLLVYKKGFAKHKAATKSFDNIVYRRQSTNGNNECELIYARPRLSSRGISREKSTEDAPLEVKATPIPLQPCNYSNVIYDVPVNVFSSFKSRESQQDLKSEEYENMRVVLNTDTNEQSLSDTYNSEQ